MARDEQVIKINVFFEGMFQNFKCVLKMSRFAVLRKSIMLSRRCKLKKCNSGRSGARGWGIDLQERKKKKANPREYARGKW